MSGQRMVQIDEPMGDLKVFQLNPLEDHRGSFTRLFCATELADSVFNTPIRQINRSVTLKKGAARGLHFQRPPHMEDKLLTCIAGKVLDIVVDIRKNSPTFLKCHYQELSAENSRSLLIPKGFAHGFQTLEENCGLLYFHTHDYTPEAEAGLNLKDPKLGIELPLPITDHSNRDVEFENISQEFEGFEC